jgi:hypothetical protein
MVFGVNLVRGMVATRSAISASGRKARSVLPEAVECSEGWLESRGRDVWTGWRPTASKTTNFSRSCSAVRNAVSPEASRSSRIGPTPAE